MAKAVAAAVLDAALDKIATATIMTACSAEPTTRTEAVTTYALADVTLSSGDYTKAAGDAGGQSRKVTVAQKSGVTVDASGTANHVALCDGSVLLYVTTCTSQSLTSGNTVTFNAWKVEFAGPT
jgi:hypothetical protein